MKHKTFLPSELFYTLLTLFLFSLFKFNILLNIIVIILISISLYIFRRRNIPFRETDRDDGEIFLSPVDGKVESIRENVTLFDGSYYGYEIRVSMNILDSKGLYLPTSAEVTFLRATTGIKLHRNSPSENFYRPMDEVAHTDLMLSLKNKKQSLIRFVDCKTGTRPVVWMKSGDIGRGAACFGYYPFGGTLLIYLPGKCDILIFEGERLVPGQSVIAVLKDKMN